ncbi:hypothetical protein ON010_g3051 [Phytophthora cinnamomi]|nr:hypothetical protein ON010_g3051 [Phytophthora cinnamomi]
MQLYRLFLVASTSVLLSGEAIVSAADSTQEIVSGIVTYVEPVAALNGGKRSLRARETTADKDDEERATATNAYRTFSSMFERVGWTTAADNMLTRAWKFEGKSTAAAAKELNLLTSPGKMDKRAMTLYNKYVSMTSGP